MTADEELLFHRGSCLCANHELRITERCLADDLGLAPDTHFKEALKHPIVQGFVEKRRSDTGSGKTVGPEAGKKTFYHLGRGDDHRGATLLDQRAGVVWLCGYGHHRSGESDDAFQRFKALIGADQMRPKHEDYLRLANDRNGRLVELGPIQGNKAAVQALANPGEVVTVNLAHQIQVRLTAEAPEEVTEICIAFSSSDLNYRQVLFVIRCFAGTTDDVWENVDKLGEIPLLGDEIGFRILRETGMANGAPQS